MEWVAKARWTPVAGLSGERRPARRVRPRSGLDEAGVVEVLAHLVHRGGRSPLSSSVASDSARSSRYWRQPE